MTPRPRSGHHRAALDPRAAGPCDEVRLECAAAARCRAVGGAQDRTTVPTTPTTGIRQRRALRVCCRFALPFTRLPSSAGQRRASGVRARSVARALGRNCLLAASRICRTPRSSPARAGSPSPRSVSRSRFRTSWLCRPSPSTGSSATTSGRPASPPRSAAGSTTIPETSGPRGDLRGDHPDRGLQPAPCRCRSATTASSRRSTPSTSAARRTSPTPRRCSSPPSS